MFNIGGPEVVVIALLALIVLGPDKLPSAARQVGKWSSELRRMASGFQQEMQSAMREAVPADLTDTPSDPARAQLEPPSTPSRTTPTGPTVGGTTGDTPRGDLAVDGPDTSFS